MPTRNFQYSIHTEVFLTFFLLIPTLSRYSFKPSGIPKFNHSKYRDFL